MEKGLGWKIYFYLVVLTTLCSAFAVVYWSEGAEIAWLDWYWLPLSLFEIIGLFGFVYYKRVMAPLFWKLLLVASLADAIWGFIEMLMSEYVKPYPLLLTLFVVAVYIAFAPLFYAIFQYGFRSRELWSQHV